jgi:hypothetical protein
LALLAGLPLFLLVVEIRRELHDTEQALQSGTLRLPTSWLRIWLAMVVAELMRHAPAAQWRSLRVRLNRLRVGRIGRRR